MIGGAFLVSLRVDPMIATLMSVAMCVLAVLIAVPIGGTWAGLPMSHTILGSVPRTWALLLRIMIALTWRRMALALPVMLLAALSFGLCLNAVCAGLVISAEMVLVLVLPTILAAQVGNATQGGIEPSLGRWYWTALHVLLTLMQLTAGLIMVFSSIQVTEGSAAFGAVVIAITAAVSVLLSAIHLLLLRHAYRSTIDFLPWVRRQTRIV